MFHPHGPVSDPATVARPLLKSEAAKQVDLPGQCTHASSQLSGSTTSVPVKMVGLPLTDVGEPILLGKPLPSASNKVGACVGSEYGLSTEGRPPLGAV